ncbi:MAG TPA: DUF4249 family protein [Balneolales bacterium]|nr:DUF4249 family protein [Balneolales bacterium]
MLFITMISACSINNAHTFHPDYFVQAYLIANAPLPVIHLSKTIAIDDNYGRNKIAVPNAIVRLQLLKDNTPQEIFHYDYDDTRNVYQPNTITHVLPGRTYRLDITFTDNRDHISAQTTVPESFHIIRIMDDTVTYEQHDPIQLLATSNPGNRQTKYLFNIISQYKITLTPYYKQQLALDPNKGPNWYYNVTSQIFNESSFKQDGENIELIVPWNIIAFYGENLVITNIIDTNTYDFLRSINASGDGFSSNNTNEVISHITGGTGIFGSMSRDSVYVYVMRE